MRSIAGKLITFFALTLVAFGQTRIDLDTQTKGSRLPFWGGTDSGTTNAYVINTIAPVLTLYTGSKFIFKAVNASTGASTLTVNSFSSHPIKKNGSTAIASGDIGANQIIEVVYDGTNYQLIGPGVLTATSPGGSSGNLQYNNSGSFGGFADGTSTQVLHGGRTFSAVSLTADVTGTLPVANGGTGTASTLTGLVRGNASAMTAAELSGDATTSGSNAVTVAKVNGGSIPTSATALASNGSNQVIAATYQGNGSKVQLSTGSTTSGNCAKFDVNGNVIDAGINCGGGGGGGTSPIVQIETHNASSSSSLDFTSCISGSYQTYKVEFYGFTPSASSSDLYFLASTDGGSTYLGSTNYQYANVNYNSNSAGASVYNHTGTSQLEHLANCCSVNTWVNTAGTALSGELTLRDFNSSSVYKQVDGYTNMTYSDGTMISFWIHGSVKNTTAINAFRLIPSTGNIASGTATCYGITP